MGKGRLEAFSDGVIAVIITIMVLELKIPHGAGWEALAGVAPAFASYVLSFVFVAIYWNNHHHLLYAVERVDGGILWANSHLLFWLSIVPAATAWLGENFPAPVPTAVYGAALLMPAVAWTILQRAIIRQQGERSLLAAALGDDRKGKLSLLLCAVGIGLAFMLPWVSMAIYASVAILWLVPDRRIAAALGDAPHGE